MVGFSGSHDWSKGRSESTTYLDPKQREYLEKLWGASSDLFGSRQTPLGGYNSSGINPGGWNGGFSDNGNGTYTAQGPQMMAFSGSQGYDPNVAGFDPAQVQAQNYAMDASRNFGKQAVPVNDAFNFALSSPINPYTEQLYQQAARPVIRSLNEQVLPSIRGNSQGAGGYSSRTGVAEGIAARGAGDTLGDISTGIYNNAYNTGMNTMMGALNMAPQMANYNMMPADWMNQVGAQRQGQNQRVLDAPWLNVSRYQDAIGAPIMNTSSYSKNWRNAGSFSMGGMGGGSS